MKLSTNETSLGLVTYVTSPLTSITQITMNGYSLLEEGASASIIFLGKEDMQVAMYKYTSAVTYSIPNMPFPTARIKTIDMYRVVLVSTLLYTTPLSLSYLTDLSNAGVTQDRYLSDEEVLAYLNAIQAVGSRN